MKPYGVIYGLFHPLTGDLRYVGQTRCSFLGKLFNGLSKVEVAKDLGVSESFIYKRIERSGVTTPKLKRGPKPRVHV